MFKELKKQKLRRRLAGEEGVGKYTSFERNKFSLKFCVYCGCQGDKFNKITREHLPSKAFLLKPYPLNLMTLPACQKCNKSYSEDEEYVATFLEYLKMKISGLDLQSRDQLNNRLKRDGLSNRLKLQVEGHELCPKFEKSRFENVLIKLARGHVAYEDDLVLFSDKPLSLRYSLLTQLSNSEIDAFNAASPNHVFPEIGSRRSADYFSC